MPNLISSPQESRNPVFILATIGALFFGVLAFFVIILGSDGMAGYGTYKYVWMILRAARTFFIPLTPVFMLFVYGLLCFHLMQSDTSEVTRQKVYLCSKTAFLCVLVVIACACLKLFMPTRDLVLSITSDIALGVVCAFLLVGIVRLCFRKEERACDKRHSQPTEKSWDLTASDREIRAVTVRASAAVMMGFMVIPYAFLAFMMNLTTVTQAAARNNAFHFLDKLIVILQITGSFIFAAICIAVCIAIFKKIYSENHVLAQRNQVLTSICKTFLWAYIAFTPFYITYFWFVYDFCSYSPYGQFFSMKLMVVMSILAVLIFQSLIVIAKHIPKGKPRVFLLVACIAPMLILAVSEGMYAVRGETLAPLFRVLHKGFVIYLWLAIMAVWMQKSIGKQLISKDMTK